MKRPLCLIGTTLATMAGLAAPIAPPDNDNDIDVGVGRSVHDAMGGSRLGHHPIIVPVPPVAEAGASADHWPHPSYLNHTNNNNGRLLPSSSSGRRRRKKNKKRQLMYHHLTNGTFHNLVLLLRFADHTSRLLPTQAHIDRLYNSEEYDIDTGEYLDFTGDDVVPTGSVRQVYRANSYNTFTIETTVIDWITLSKPESYYAAGNHGFSKFKEAIIEALSELDLLNQNPDEAFSFDDFDLDDNGALDGLGVLHSGHGAEFQGEDCYGAENEGRIWSHKGGIDWDSRRSVSDGSQVKVNRYYVSSTLRGKCNSQIVRMGVICHEIGHYIGLPDLYDGTFEGTGLGAYDFMSQSWGLDGSGMYPPNLSAWSRLQVGWATVVLIEFDGTYELEASAKSDKVYKITAGYPDGEYLLIENRQPVGYDSQIIQGGLAVYHVDEKAIDDSQRYAGFPGMPNDAGVTPPWPRNGHHYRVALLGADGNYDLERGTNQGDEWDLWHAGSRRELSPGGTHPNTDAYQNGQVLRTGARIFGFSESGDVMSFMVSELGVRPTSEPTRVPTMVPTSEPTMVPTTIAPTSQPTSKPTTREPTTIAPTSQPSSKPTTLQPTANPATNAPTKQPTLAPNKSKPWLIASKTSKPTTSTPSSQPTAASPSFSPTTFLQCRNLCLAPIDEIDCPADPYGLPDCLAAELGEICDADGECDTNQYLNNCKAYDVYRRVPCDEFDDYNVSATAATVAATTTTAATTSTTTTNATSISAFAVDTSSVSVTAATLAAAVTSSSSTTTATTFSRGVSFGVMKDEYASAANTFVNAAATSDVSTANTSASAASVTDGAVTVDTEANADPIMSMEHYHHAALDGMPPQLGLTQPQEETDTGIVMLAGEDANLVILTGSPTLGLSGAPTRSPLKEPSQSPSKQLTGSPTKAPSKSPVAKPTVPPFLWAQKPLSDTGIGGSKPHCPYYPGWNQGLSHCLKDCHQPSYMTSNPIFEFDSMEKCCQLHYQGRESCTTQTVLEIESDAIGRMGSVSGQVWKDSNGNDWQDVTERRMGGGVAGVMVDLYMCLPDSSSMGIRFSNANRWVKGTRTSFDGTYLMDEIEPGWYFVQVTSPDDYHLSESHPGWENDFDSDFDEDGRSECLQFESGVGGELKFDAGLIPNAIDTDMAMKTELVSAVVDGEFEEEEEQLQEQVSRTTHLASAVVDGESEEEEEQPREDASAASHTSVMHAKSRTSSNEGIRQPPDAITLPNETPTAHNKSGLRGTPSYTDLATAMVTIHPTDDATIHSQMDIMFVGGKGELLVGPHLTWHNDALLKFDVSPFILTDRGDYRTAKRAVLRLYSLISSPSGGVVHSVTATSNYLLWDENHVTWSAAPEAGEILASIGQVHPNTWIEVDVTGMMSLTASGIATLRLAGDITNHSWMAKYSSKENNEGHPGPEILVYF